MATPHSPGIAIEQIRLLKASIAVADPSGKLAYNLRLTGFSRTESDDGAHLDVHALFDLMHGVESPRFTFTCEFVARYTRRGEDSMPWSEFTSAVALAHIIPYLREFVSNMTNRLPVPVLMLDPVNTHAMIASFEKRRVPGPAPKPVAAPRRRKQA